MEGALSTYCNNLHISLNTECCLAQSLTDTSHFVHRTTQQIYGSSRLTELDASTQQSRSKGKNKGCAELLQPLQQLRQRVVPCARDEDCIEALDLTYPCWGDAIENSTTNIVVPLTALPYATNRFMD